MLPRFDIFRISEGKVVWCQSADSLDEAQRKAELLAQTDKCEHVILDQTTGHQVTVRLERASSQHA